MATGGRTALVQPALEQLGKRLGAFLPPSFLVDDAPQLGQTTMEALEVRLVVHCGFVHVAEDLLFKEYRCKYRARTSRKEAKESTARRPFQSDMGARRAVATGV